MSGVLHCSSIYLENISTTIKSFEENIFTPLNISIENWTSDIGSVGKKPVSGDIDIAVDIDYCEPNQIIEQIKKKGYKFTKTGGAIANIEFPIEGTQKGQYVQIDIFPTKSLEFTKFARFSPTPEESKYKGALRCDLLGVLIKYCTLLVNEDESKFSYISLKQDGAFKTVRYVDNPHLKAEFEDVLITDKPEDLINMVFGEKYNIKHFNSFESIFTIMTEDDFPYKHIVNDVIDRFEEIEINKKRNIPEEIINYKKEKEND